MNLPRILLVSEVTLSYSNNGHSANPTLYNLFENYPPELLMSLSPAKCIKASPPVPPFNKQALAFREGYLPKIHNRLGRNLINPAIESINRQLLDFFPIPHQDDLSKFNPQIVLASPITPVCLQMSYKLTKHFQCPFLIYFMDYWIGADRIRFPSGSAKEIIYKLLKKADAWLMISEQLQSDLSTDYQIQPKRSIVVHNPVDLSKKQPPAIEVFRQGTFEVVYAGSVQVMHYDALAAIAEAIFQLRREGKDIELLLHTHQAFWNFYKKDWENWEVRYGGLIPYSELNEKLKSADLLLVATSFMPKYSQAVRSSVLTKLTDYMAAGRPILACGPDYSASNRFIKKWDCGLVCETNKISEVKELLVEQMKNSQSNQKLAIKAFEVLKTNFEKNKVSAKLYEFIREVHNNSKL